MRLLQTRGYKLLSQRVTVHRVSRGVQAVYDLFLLAPLGIGVGSEPIRKSAGLHLWKTAPAASRSGFVQPAHPLGEVDSNLCMAESMRFPEVMLPKKWMAIGAGKAEFSCCFVQD
jgi:hypothetical protein